MTIVPRHARRGFQPGAAEPIASFRTAATKLITRYLADRGFPALWIASVERSEGWGPHAHIALHLPPSLSPAELQAALVRRFAYDIEAIDRENAKRIARGLDDLVFQPANVTMGQSPDDGPRFVDYVTKGAHEPQGTFRCSPLTTSHALAELVRKHEPQLAHITASSVHRHFGRDHALHQRQARVQEVTDMLRRFSLAP